jgi:hypothetical protein
VTLHEERRRLPMTTILRSLTTPSRLLPYVVLPVVSLAALACSGDPDPTGAGGTAGSAGSAAGAAGGTGGGGTGGTGPQTECEIAGTRLCELACECDKTEKCSVEGTSGAIVQVASEAGCKGLYVTANCSKGGSPLIDYPTCIKDLETAMCNAKGNAVKIPESCTEMDP